jgi:hypothetical protein
MRELILTTLSDQPDIEIVGEVEDEADIMERVESTNPDFVIIAQDVPRKGPNVCDMVLRRRPDIRVIAVAPHHNYLVYYWASPDIRSRHVEASEEALLGVLRTKPAGGVA